MWPLSLVRSLIAPPAPVVDLELAGRQALAEAVRLFALDVWDPPTGDHRPEAERWRTVITSLIASDAGLGWSWEGRYPGDGSGAEWCGAFASACWGAAGLPLATRRRSWASCLRLQRWASCRPGTDGKPNPPPKVGARLCIALDEHARTLPAGYAFQPGDVIIVGGVGSGAGRHITVAESFDGEAFATIEGNGVGLGPDGKRRQGIVRARRPLGLRAGQGPHTYHARWIIRPAVGDLA